MMRAAHFRQGYPDRWTKNREPTVDTFNLQLPPNGFPASPPPSTKTRQNESSNGFYSREQPYSLSMNPISGAPGPVADLNNPSYQITPLSSPAIDTNFRNSYQLCADNMENAYIAGQLDNDAALSALQTPPPVYHLTESAWVLNTPTSLDFRFSASPEFQTPSKPQQQSWISSTAPQPPTSTFHTSSQVDSRNNCQNQNMSINAASMAGLGISCDSTAFDLDQLQSKMWHDGFSISLEHTPLFYNSDSTAMISTHHQNGMNMTRTTSASRLLSSSPPPVQRLHRTTLRMNPNHHPSSRKSSASNPHSQSSPRRKSSTGNSQSNPRPASVGFVNFTPEDSRKILMGVAPSGSSKTKARREKEAVERRRKLSQAAVRAVVEAGGDIRGLEEEGLLCE
ncbi:hypothetical protein GQ43DRAFT_470941 [Delitschia confertaspora ATCC 74209]|uniref:Developmental regulatory protein wetA n=1 Tax=Delitschia confertaspora ATCC 74209 TaxID=1513339 RepID=A0A9P4JTQ7_9PLEO|nr:hypothetical protein GQ43DRAFT_470941 [Delitschia confertaspora ATCC 74209]